jgi:peroxin-12
MSDLRPSFFELYAAERLTSALRPALRYTLEVLSVRNPRLLPFAARSDDLFASLSLLLETAHLASSSSTLSESFYSLRRARDFKHNPNEHLSVAQIVASVLLVVVVPHAKLKLDDAYSAHSGGPLADLMRSSRAATAAASSSSPTSSAVVVPGQQQPKYRVPRSVRDLAALIRTIASRLHLDDRFLRYYPALHASYEGFALLFNVAYLFGHTRYFTASFFLQRLVVRQLSPREAAAASISRPTTISAALLSGAKTAAVVSVFAFRFLEYYFAAESRMPRQGTVVPPPPEPLLPARGIDLDLTTSRSHTFCPICERPRVNPAACVVSGYVFCYSCIVSYLDKNRRCPVTLLPATTADIIRVMS